MSNVSTWTPRSLLAGGVRIDLYVDERIAPDERALTQLYLLSRVPGVTPPLVALPDVHYKARNPAPTGTVTAVSGGVIPLALDAGLNCGMRVHLVDAHAAEVGTERLTQLFERLRAAVPTGWHAEPVLSEAELGEVLKRGAAWVVERRDGRGGPAGRIENGGALSVGNPLRLVPPQAARRARRGLGVLGSGNHFLELHVVQEVLHDHGGRLGLEQGRLLVMLHSGSGVLGKTFGLFFGARRELKGRRAARFAFEKLAYHAVSPGLSAERLRYFHRDGRHDFHFLPEDSPEGRRYLAAVAAAANFGYANRAALGAAVEESVSALLGVGGAPLLYDVSHNLVQRERHGGEWLYIHRQGASRALPGAFMPDDDVLGATGQPFPVPGSMGAEAYLCVGTDGAAATYHSANHGAGRVLDKPEARHAFTAAGVRDELAAQGIGLFKEGGGSLEEQAPGAFKDITAVMEVMRASGIALPVARTRPLAVLKG